MRTLTFTPDAIHYRLLHQATLFTKRQMSPQDFRLLAKLQEKLEAIGEPVEGDAGQLKFENQTVRLYTSPDGGEVLFEEAEWALLRACVENTTYAPAAARFIAGLWDLLDATKEESLKAVKAREAAKKLAEPPADAVSEDAPSEATA